MATKAPATFTRVVDAHRARLEELVDGRGRAVGKMKKLYDDAQDALTKRLAAAVKAGKGDKFTAFQQRVMLAQVRQGQKAIASKMAGALRPLSKQAQEKALSGLVGDVARLSKAFTGAEVVLPVEEAARFAEVIDKRNSSLLKMHQASMARYGANVVQEVQHTMAMSLLTGEDVNDTIDAVADTIGGQWWQGERIVRTEMAFAFNASHFDGIKDAAKEIPELKQRWEENCDASGQPLDDRVAVDSIAMHGQVVDAGDLFTMPGTAPFADARGLTQVPQHLVGEQWPFPPNRPNDRSVLSPWMEDWGVPGWRYVGGRRVPL